MSDHGGYQGNCIYVHRQRLRKRMCAQSVLLLLLLFLFPQIRASDSTGTENLIMTLGTGDDLKTKLNSELKKQGLAEATRVTAITRKAELSSATAAVSPKWVMVLVSHVLALGLINRS